MQSFMVLRRVDFLLYYELRFSEVYIVFVPFFLIIIILFFSIQDLKRRHAVTLTDRTTKLSDYYVNPMRAFIGKKIFDLLLTGSEIQRRANSVFRPR